MPESIIQDKYVDAIPRFTLPVELTNVPEKPEAPAAPPAAPAPEAKQAPKPSVAEAATPEPDKTEPESPDAKPDEEKATSRRFERRIDRAHRRAAEAQARAELLEKQLAEVKAQQAPKPPTTAPRMEDYTDPQKYAEDFAKHRETLVLQDYERKQRENVFQQRQLRMSQDWEAKTLKASEKYEDFEEIVGDLKPTTPWAVAIMRAENGEDVAYHLGKHPQEARKIIALDPEDQFLEIGRLSARLAVVSDKPKTPSKAPAPITPVAAEAKGSGDEIRENQPFEEYMKIGNKMFRRH